jgi:hypothetical protein
MITNYEVSSVIVLSSHVFFFTASACFISFNVRDGGSDAGRFHIMLDIEATEAII